MKEKTYTLKLTETEMKNPAIKKCVVAIAEIKLKGRKYHKFLRISTMEYEMIRKHYSWVDVTAYNPNKKDRYKNEVGKYNGKRCVLR